MFEAFREPFMQLALGASLTVALVGAVLGVYVVLRRVVFVGAALSQLSASGVALAFLLGLDGFDIAHHASSITSRRASCRCGTTA